MAVMDRSNEALYKHTEMKTVCDGVGLPQPRSHVHSDCAFWSLRVAVFLLARLLLFINFTGLLFDVSQLHPPPPVACG